ncbi:MAG: DUF2029 domain-containing protein, partial [Thermoplasmata archaeon]|nr:DUF2029 domain-containing protein [Thermoplasmata archaeon]
MRHRRTLELFPSRLKREYYGIPIFLYPILLVYLLSLLFIAFVGFYVLPDVLFILSFILLLPHLGRLMKSPLLEKVKGWKSRERLIALFILALLLRGVLLFNSEVITNDIDLYVGRSEALMNGTMPYVETEMHKPPMYAYMLYLLGIGLGPGHIQFRAFFSIVDSLLAVGVYYLLRKKFQESYSLYGALAYAICPINIISTGLEGHYDPLVSLFVVLALYLYLKGKVAASSLSLGVAFAFKLYPFIFAPFLVWRLKSWKDRIWYGILFFVPMVLSFLPLYLLDPKTVEIYLNYQGEEWMDQAMKSFARAYELLTDSQEILGMRHSEFFMYIFLTMV